MSLSKKNDILEELRNMYYVSFMSKHWDPFLPNKEGLKLTVEDLITLIQRSVRLQLAMRKINKLKGTSMLQMRSTVRQCLLEVGHHRNMAVIRWVGIALCHILKKNYKGIIVNEESIANVKAKIGCNPVIFAPSHRSYADFILMSFLCFYYDIEIPVIAAGQDFQSMWVMGRVLRECCAFFIRRSFGDDALYKAVIAEYVSLLIQFSHTALEFFIEGTRSRSGKSLLPKFGLMNMALEPYFYGKVPDVTIVPINITYERCLEDSLFARELLGIPKPKESTKRLLRALQVLRENYGRIYVEFGEPISVRKFCEMDICKIDPRVDLNQASSFYSERIYPGPRVSQCVQDLCYSVIREQNRIMTFLPVHITAVSVAVWHIFEDNVPLEKIEADVEYLRDVLVVLGYSIEVKESLEKEVKEVLKIHNRVIYLCERERAVKLHLGVASSTISNSTQDSKLTEQTITEAYPVMFLQLYANPVCMACIHICILNFIMCTARKVEEYTKDLLFEEYSFYRSLFQVEFVLYMEDSSLIEIDFENAIEHMCALNLFFTATVEKETLDFSNLEALRKIKRDQEALLLGLLQPFLTGYALILKLILAMASKVNDLVEKELKYILQKKLEDELSIGRYIPKYVLSTDLIGNALSAYTRMGALQRWQKGDLMMVRPIVSACRSIYQDIEIRLVKLHFLVEASYQRFSYDHIRKHKFYACKL